MGRKTYIVIRAKHLVQILRSPFPCFLHIPFPLEQPPKVISCACSIEIPNRRTNEISSLQHSLCLIQLPRLEIKLSEEVLSQSSLNGALPCAVNLNSEGFELLLFGAAVVSRAFETAGFVAEGCCIICKPASWF